MHSRHQRKLFIGLGLLALGAAVGPAKGAAYFTANGVQQLGNPQGWGGVNNTSQSVAFELNFDFTTAVDAETNPIDLWEAGATGSGAALVLNNDLLHFFAGNSNDDVITGNHSLFSPQGNVQIVSVFEVDGGGDETLSIYVNGALIGSGDFSTANSWAGSDPGALGTNSGNTRYVGTGLFTEANIQDYPTDDISFAVYTLADNQLGDILVAPIPEPSSLTMIGLGSLLLLRRRR